MRLGLLVLQNGHEHDSKDPKDAITSGKHAPRGKGPGEKGGCNGRDAMRQHQMAPPAPDCVQSIAFSVLLDELGLRFACRRYHGSSVQA